MSNIDDLVYKYNRLNNSFEKTYVFHLGANAGFFSEYNNMILAMLYCLKNKIKFVLYSKTANFGVNNGWSDYFHSFCEENENLFHAKYNYRYPIKLSSEIEGIINSYKSENYIDYLTYELWNLFRNKDFEEDHYEIPELDINGDIIHACSILIELTWNYNQLTSDCINNLAEKLELPSNYIGLHIRAGDKSIESELKPVDAYIDKVNTLTNIKDAFVLTDDYTIIEELRKKHLDWNFYTLCEEQERGYIHNKFMRSNSEIKMSHLFKLFLSVDILAISNYFIGTFTSNVGMYLGMKMPKGKCYGIDINEWHIW